MKRLANDMKVVRMPGTTTSKYKRNFNRETSRWDYLISLIDIHLKFSEVHSGWMNLES